MTDITSIADQSPRHSRVDRPEIKVWDRFVRVFHWSVVGLFILAFATQDSFETVHQVAGYAIMVLVALRLVWGLIGPEHARFRSFLRSPRTVIAFLFDTARLRARRYIGHNPAGGLMVVALLAMLTLITVSGAMQTMDAFWGQKWVEELHEGAVFATLGLIGLHLVGVLIASIEHGENLVRAMFTGRKRAPDGE